MMLPRHETLVGQIKAAIQDAISYSNPNDENSWVRVLSEPEELPIEEIYVGRESEPNRSLSILHICEKNIKCRRSKEEPDNATWLIRDESIIIDIYDLILVSYGVATEGGEWWPESAGNKRKLSYRRLGYTNQVSCGKFGYNEIPTIMTERNIQLAWDGMDLEDRCDYSNKGY